MPPKNTPSGLTPTQGASAILYASLTEEQHERLRQMKEASDAQEPIPDDMALVKVMCEKYAKQGWRGVYGSVCAKCEHTASTHLLADDGDLRAGPYRCTECGCEQPQEGPWLPLTKRQFEHWEANRGT